MKNYYLIILTFTVLSILSCGKKVHDYHFNGKILLAIGIDTGSVFVYQDSITNEIDTLVVTKNDLHVYDPVHSEEEDHYTIDIRDISFESKNKLVDSSYFDFNYDAWATGNRISTSIGITTPDSSLGKWGMRIFEDEFVTREFITKEVNNAIKVHENMNLKGNTYNTVYENLFRFPDTLNHDFCQSYFSPESGLIKFRLQKGNYFTVKELIYSKIKRL